MSAAIECDRCSACEPARVGQVDLTVETTTKIKNGDREQTGLGYDLCNGCALELQAWLETPPVKAAP